MLPNFATVFLHNKYLHNKSRKKLILKNEKIYGVNRPDPARPDRHAFERLITRKQSIIQKKVITHKMFVNFIKLMYQFFRKILRIVFEL